MTSQYAVVLDAGSSGTRVRLYSWDGAPGAVPVVAQIAQWKPSVGVGIATLAPIVIPPPPTGMSTTLSQQPASYPSLPLIESETLDKVKAYLQPHFQYIHDKLPNDRVSTTPLFVLATGGMRRVKLENNTGYEILRTAIITYINATSFQTPFYDTISGEDEALYGWVSANTVAKKFDLDRGALPGTVGFVELGGESAQFALALTQQEARDYRGQLRKVIINQHEYLVYVRSWMGLGADAGWKRHEARLRASESAIPHDPCLPKEYAYHLAGSDKIVLGTGDFPRCFEECLELFECPNTKCRSGYLCIYQEGNVGCLLRDSMTGTPTIDFRNRFLGASVFVNIMQGRFRADADFAALWKRMLDDSALGWSELSAGRAGDPYLKRSFFTTGLAMSMLFLGFGVKMPRLAALQALSFAEQRASLELHTTQQNSENGMQKQSGGTETLASAIAAVSEAAKDVDRLVRNEIVTIAEILSPAIEAQSHASEGSRQNLPEALAKAIIGVKPQLLTETQTFSESLTRGTQSYTARPTEANFDDLMRLIKLRMAADTPRQAAELRARKTTEQLNAAAIQAKKLTSNVKVANLAYRQAQHTVGVLGSKRKQYLESELQYLDTRRDHLEEKRKQLIAKREKIVDELTRTHNARDIARNAYHLSLNASDTDRSLRELDGLESRQLLDAPTPATEVADTLYEAVGGKVDWTHGRIVLHVNRYQEDIRSPYGWVSN